MCWSLAWLHEHRQHWRDLAVLMADKLRLAFTTMEEQTVLSAPLRLVGMAEGYGVQMGRGGARRVLAVTQQELEAQGILRVQRGGMEILDLSGPRTLSR